MAQKEILVKSSGQRREKVVHALRQENRWHHYGDWNLSHPAKRALKEAFGPGDPSWRSKVLNRGEEVFRQSTALAFGD